MKELLLIYTFVHILAQNGVVKYWVLSSWFVQKALLSPIMLCEILAVCFICPSLFRLSSLWQFSLLSQSALLWLWEQSLLHKAKCGLKTSASVPGDFLYIYIYTESQALPKNYWIRTCIVRSCTDDSHTHWSLRKIAIFLSQWFASCQEY